MEKHIIVLLLFLVPKHKVVVPHRFSLPWLFQSLLWKHICVSEKQYSAKRLIFTSPVKRTNLFCLFLNVVNDIFIRQRVPSFKVMENSYSLSTLFATDECMDLHQFLPQLSFFQDGKLWDFLLNHLLYGSCARFSIAPVAFLWISSGCCFLFLVWLFLISLEISNHNLLLHALINSSLITFST